MMHSTTELTQRQATVRMVHLDMTCVVLVRVATVNDDELLYDMRELVVEKFLQLKQTMLDTTQKQDHQLLKNIHGSLVGFSRTFL